MLSETKPVRERIEEALREIGVLLLAFTPLDGALNGSDARPRGVILIFLALGLCLFFGAVFLEQRRRGGQTP